MKSEEKLRKDKQAVSQIWKATESYPTSFQPNVDQAWNRFKGQMQEAPAKPAAKVRSINWLRTAAAAVAVVVCAFAAWTLLANGEVVYMTANAGDTQQELVLPDGTNITLAPNSVLKYPESFTAEERDVQLSGMAFFDVEHDPSRPFSIQTDNGEVQVLGTSFIIRSYPSENLEEVIVKTGKVAYTVAGQESGPLTAGHKALFDKTTSNLQLLKETPEYDWAWINGELLFSDMTLGEALMVLERNYNASFNMDSMSGLLSCPITLKLTQHPELEEVLNAVSVLYRAELQKDANHIYSLKGGSCQ